MIQVRTHISKPLIFVVISVLVVALVYSSFTPFIVFAVTPDSRWESSEAGRCNGGKLQHPGAGTTCCWRERIPGQLLGETYCQTCFYTEDGKWDCDQKELQMLEQPPTPQPFDPTAPLQGGVLEQPPTPPPSGPAAPLQGGVLEQLEQGEATPGFVPGFLQRQEQQPPADQGTGSEVPRTVEPLPPTCAPGSVFDPDINECVLENPPELCPDGGIPQLTGPGGMQPECPPSEAEQPQAEESEQPSAEDPEQQQSSEEGDGSSEDNSNNN